jgi:hypothetical protein
MLRWLRELWIGSDPLELESAFSLAESVERLKAATGTSFFSGLTRERTTGTVRESRVSLQRTIPMVGNSFKPFFQGRFVQKDGRIFLVGRFAIHWAVRAFMTLWFSGLVLIGLLATIAPGTTQKGARVPMLLGVPGMICLGLGLIRLGQWFARNDASWLEKMIRRALTPSEGASGSPPVVPAPETSLRKPPVILGATAVLGLLGIMVLVTALRGPGLQPYAPHSSSRELAAAVGALTLALAYGVFRQRRIAWRAFFLFLGVGWLGSAWQLGLATPQGLPSARPPVFIGLSLISIVVWGLWWYGLRENFTK